MKVFNIAPKKKITIRPLINVGCLMDIPTSNLLKGMKGEIIMNGGLGSFDGIAGPPNNFKSRVARYILLKAADRMSYSYPTGVHIYDTEDSMLSNPDNILKELNQTDNLKEDALDDNRVTITTKADVLANEWAKDNLYALVDMKVKDKSATVEYTAFKNGLTSKDTLKYLIPNFIAIDSVTKLEPSNTVEELEKGNIDNNTLEMRKNLFKSKLIGDLPRLANKGGLYIVVTAHMNKEINIPTGPGFSMPQKSIQYLKTGDKIKGITGEGLYLATHFWIAHMTRPLINQTTKEPEFPDKVDDVNTDLHVLKLTLLRSKSGHSGITIELVISQSEGVLPDLTNFYFIKTHGTFGLEGNPRSYYLSWLPDIKLSRTTVRKKLKENEQLRRATEIMADILQLYMHHTSKRQVLFGDLLEDGIAKVPEKILAKMKKKNIPMDVVLNTRNWWTIDNYNKNLKPYLSVVDLLNWVNGIKTPWWYKEEKKK